MALFVGLWFVAVSAGPELTHACPTHSAHATAASADAHAGHTPATPGASSAGNHRGTDSDSSNQCTCLGHCCSTTPVALAVDAVAVIDTMTDAMRDAGLPDYDYVPVAAQHVLPLANGPPLSA